MKLRSVLRKTPPEHRRCKYCDQPLAPYSMLPTAREQPLAPSIDHWQAAARGGPNLPENAVLSCKRCNLEKGILHGDEYIAWRQGLASRLDLGKLGNVWKELVLAREVNRPAIIARLKWERGRGLRWWDED